VAHPVGPRSHQFGRGILEFAQAGNQWSLSFGFAEILADLLERIHFPVQSKIRGKQAVQVDFGESFKAGVLIALLRSVVKESRVIGRILRLVSILGLILFCVMM
jgi:hypothetical protein